MDDTNKINKKSKVAPSAKLSGGKFDSKKSANGEAEGIDPVSENLSLLRTLVKNNFKYIKAQNTLLRKDIATLNLSLKNIIDKLSSLEEMGFDKKTDNKSNSRNGFFSFKEKKEEKKTKDKDKPKSSSKPASSFSSSKDSFDNPIFDRLKSKLFKEIDDLDFLLKSVRFLFGGALAGGTLFNKSKKEKNNFEESSTGKKTATFAESPIDWEKTNFAYFFPLLRQIKDGLFFSNTVPYLALLDENMLWVSSELRVATTLLGNMEKLTKEELNEIRKSNRKTVLRRRKPLSDDQKVPEKKPMIYFKKRVSLADAGSSVADNMSNVSQMNKFSRFITPMLSMLPFILIALPALLFFAKQAYRTFYRDGKSISEVTGSKERKKKENIFNTWKYGIGEMWNDNFGTERDKNGLIKRNKIEPKRVLFDTDGKYIDTPQKQVELPKKPITFLSNRQKPSIKTLENESSKIGAVNMMDNKDFKNYKDFMQPKYMIDEYNSNLKNLEARSYIDSNNAGVNNIIAPITNVNNNQFLTGGLKIRSQDGARLSGISTHITP
jgi:hypothetical protein